MESTTAKVIGVSPRLYSRAAGGAGVLMLASGSFSHYVNAKLIVVNDAMATAQHILAAEFLFRLGFVSALVMMLSFVFYGVLLYQLLRPVHKLLAKLMLILVLLPVPIFMLNELNHIALLVLASEPVPGQLRLFLGLQKYGALICAIFFGLWLFPLGYLVFKSGYVPKVIGVLLMIGCFGYLTLFVQGVLYPGSEATLWTNPLLLVAHIAELSLMLWLLLKGVDVEQWHKRVLAMA